MIWDCNLHHFGRYIDDLSSTSKLGAAFSPPYKAHTEPETYCNWTSKMVEETDDDGGNKNAEARWNCVHFSEIIVLFVACVALNVKNTVEILITHLRGHRCIRTTA